MIKIILFIIVFISSLFLSSGYNNFQGFLKLEHACFDTYDHKGCNSSLADVYSTNLTAVGSNPPTTKLFLFTGKSPNKAEQLHQCAGLLPPNSTFDPNCRTEIFIHGYSDSPCHTAWMREMKNQLFEKCTCYNVILVDWTWGNLPDIASAALNARAAGQQVAYALKKIHKQVNYDCANYHIVANSYGVISASYAGKNMQDPSCRLGRLTALDNALPPLKYAPMAENLNKGDAMFVDAIHTNGGPCFPFDIGDPREQGHVDIYVNDGKHQYSCIPYIFFSFLKLDVFYAIASLIYPALCYHVQSIQFYKASINAGKDNSYMIAVECDSYEKFKNGGCPRKCDKEGYCVPLGLDLPLYLNTSAIERRRIYRVPASLLCPYNDHTGFSGLLLKPIKSDCSHKL